MGQFKRRIFLAVGAATLCAPVICFAQTQQGKVWRIGMPAKAATPPKFPSSSLPSWNWLSI